MFSNRIGDNWDCHPTPHALDRATHADKRRVLQAFRYSSSKYPNQNARQVLSSLGGAGKLKEKKTAASYEHRDHALFVAFAPYDKPEIAVAVVVEHGEHGGGAAAPVAGQVLRKYFEAKGVIKRPVSDSDKDDAADDKDAGGEN